METIINGEEVLKVVYEEDGQEDKVSIYFKDGNKTEAFIL
jgi:hypothetical protein